MVKGIGRRIREKLNTFSFPGFSRKQMTILVKEIDTALNQPPRIAIIGETGVGKTTTINALFNQGLPISHTRACTQEATELNVNVTEMGKKGTNIIVYDMPGLGEDIDADKRHAETYKKVLPVCDVIVWILKADMRTMTQVQVALRDIVGPAMDDNSKLVVAINQIDLIQPGKWNKKYNLPSKEQEMNIERRKDDVAEKISKIVPIPRDQIVSYSALRNYCLLDLLDAMINACPRDRAWIIEDRARPAKFLDLVDKTKYSDKSVGGVH